MNMFDAPFNIGSKEVPVDAPTWTEPKSPTIRNDITFNRNERNDIDYRGYKAYLYQFDQTSEVQDKELYQFIISAPSVDEAIGVFMQSIRNEEYYADAVFDVEVIGIDLKTDRVTPWVMEQ